MQENLNVPPPFTMTMIEYLAAAAAIMFVIAFGLWMSRVRNKLLGLAPPQNRSIIPLLVCATSFSLTVFFMPELRWGFGSLATIALAVAFLMLMAPLEYVVIQRLRPQWLAFYRADAMFFPYFSTGISLGWIVCQTRLPQ